MHQQLQQHLQNARRLHQNLVQVRVLKTQGFTYRKNGARMLIDELGQRYDLVSGGCLETHLTRQAMEVLRNGIPKFLEYDFTDPDAPDWQKPSSDSLGCTYGIEIGWLWRPRRGFICDVTSSSRASPHASPPLTPKERIVA